MQLQKTTANDSGFISSNKFNCSIYFQFLSAATRCDKRSPASGSENDDCEESSKRTKRASKGKNIFVLLCFSAKAEFLSSEVIELVSKGSKDSGVKRAQPQLSE